MKWTYSIKNKMAASGALLALCLLVLFSNYLDRDHTNNVKNSITTLYEDRLVAEAYLLRMMNDIYQVKEIVSASGLKDSREQEKMMVLLANLQETKRAYLNTKLTANEKMIAFELAKILDAFKSRATVLETEKTDKALALLNELSVIQLEESKLIMNRVEILFFSSKASTQFAFALIVIILLVLQAIVYTSQTLISKQQLSATNLN